MNSNRILWIILSVAVVAGAFVAGYGVASNSPSSLGGRGSFVEGYEAAKKVLQDSGLIPPEQEKITSVSGKVTGVNGNSISIEANNVSLNPLADQGPKQRTIVVGTDTQLVTLIPLSPQEFSAALKQFNADSAAGKQVAPPSPFREQAITLDDIKPSMVITAQAADDIRNAETINAQKVSFTAQPSAP